MDQVIKGIINKEKNLGEENLNGVMNPNMLEIFGKITFMGKVLINLILGEYNWNDKRKYIGEWRNNKMDGEGTFIWPDGRKYIGNYKNDKKEGNGTFEWSDERKYKGNWRNGKQHGEGEFFNTKENSWRKGIWSEGKRITWNEEKTPF